MVKKKSGKKCVYVYVCVVVFMKTGRATTMLPLIEKCVKSLERCSGFSSFGCFHQNAPCTPTVTKQKKRGEKRRRIKREASC